MITIEETLTEIVEALQSRIHSLQQQAAASVKSEAEPRRIQEKFEELLLEQPKVAPKAMLHGFYGQKEDTSEKVVENKKADTKIDSSEKAKTKRGPKARS